MNESIGDKWLVNAEPPGVVHTESKHDPVCKAPGCGGELVYLITAERAGTSRVTFQYCYRSSDARTCPG